MARKNDLRQAMVAELRAAGATITLDGKTKGGHGLLLWTLNGHQGRTVYPGTASDHRSHINNVATIRRQIRAALAQ